MISRSLHRFGLWGLIGAVWAVPALAKLAADPHAAADDLVLPLPCDQVMVFRPIDVPTGAGALSDTSITTGREDTQDGYNDYLFNSWLSAPFPVPKNPELRRYYMAKYDVTRAQYAAVTSGTCPTVPAADGRLPQAKISFDEARDFATAYTVWLLTHAKASLPTRDGAPGFLRLPTEDEWSFAARGGMKVGTSDFAALTWPMPEGPDQYIAAGPETGLQPVGSLKPNPLGLYDMLGEVEQMVLDPYRPNRVGRLQGLAGGITTRGGNYLANPDELSTSSRAEHPPFDGDHGTPTRLPTMGMRLVIAAPALNSLQQTQDDRTAFDAIRKQAEAATPDAHALLQKLHDDSSDPGVKIGLSRIAAQMDADARARADAQSLALRAQFYALAALGRTIWESDHLATKLQAYVDAATGPAAANLDGVRQNIGRHRQQVAALLGGYASLLQSTTRGEGINAARLREAASIEHEALSQQGQNAMLPFLDLAAADSLKAMSGSVAASNTLLHGISAIPGDATP